jgi:hypothetical protein
MRKNITLSADEELIRKVRDKAKREKTTLNANFRLWLRQYLNRNTKTSDYQAFMESLAYAKAGRRFSRDELNER